MIKSRKKRKKHAPTHATTRWHLLTRSPGEISFHMHTVENSFGSLPFNVLITETAASSVALQTCAPEAEQ